MKVLPPSHMQAQTMLGILALGENDASGANVRSLFYKWLRRDIAHHGIYGILRRLREKGWAKRRTQLCLMVKWEHNRTTPVYYLTEAGYRALVNYIADTLWIDRVNGVAGKKLRTEAERLLSNTVERIRKVNAK